MNLAKVVTSASKALAAAAQGDPIEAARNALDAVLEAVPHTLAVQMLDEVAIRRANAIADIAEEAKFGLLGSKE